MNSVVYQPVWLTLALILTASGAVPGQTHVAADLGHRVLTAGLDPNECYRVRDLELSKDDARFYLTDGYIVFGKPVNGGPISAVFAADTDGGDAEVLLLPPDRAERKSLANYTGAPNLNEHFAQAVFLFTDETAKGLLEQIAKAGSKRMPEVGAVMVERLGGVVANLMTSFESRIVLDLLTPGAQGHGFFEAVIQGRKLGNFDIVYDARSYEQLIAGQVTNRNGTSWWDTWASFQSRSHRGQQPDAPEQTILSYRIEVTLEPSLNMKCVTRMKVRTTSESVEVLAFDLSGQMHATSAKVDGEAAEVYERESVRDGLVQNTGNELLMVIPAKKLQPGSEHEIEIAHEGKVILEAGHEVYFVSARGNWYPARGLQFATYDVTYTYPKELDLVAAGQIREDRTEGENRITRRVPEGAVRLLGFNLGKYERLNSERAGIAVEVCANKQVEDALRQARVVASEPEMPQASVRTRRTGPESVMRELTPMVVAPAVPANQNARIAEAVEDAMAFYRGKLGEPPLRRIEVSPVPGRFGQGFAGMIYLPTLNYLNVGRESSSAVEQRYFRDLLVAHEVAHQWWGNIVSTASYHHEWLMEALASYSAVLFLETKLGPRATDIALEAYRKALFQKGPDGETAESEGAVVQGRRLQGSNNPNASIAVIYGKGTWIMHMLRRRMGDERFLKMLAELRRRYELKTLDTEGFRAVCAEFLPAGSTDAKLEGFFDQWVYGTGVPALKMTFSVKGKPGAYRLTGAVTQAEVPDDYTVAVPIEIQNGRSKTVVQQVRTGSEPAQFSVGVASPGAKAVLDPGWSVLRR